MVQTLSNWLQKCGRPPHGGRGLKYAPRKRRQIRTLSPSPRRAWIEILQIMTASVDIVVALPTEGVD